MRLASAVTILGAVALTVWMVGAAWAVAEPEAPPASAKNEIRIEVRVGGPGEEPVIRKWINGVEVDPGQEITVGEGKVKVDVGATRANRERAERGRPDRDQPRDRGERGDEGGGALGVMIAPLTDELARRADVEAGVVVSGLMEGGPAAKAGLREGDVITHLNGKAMTDPEQLAETVAAHKPGDKVRVRYSREGKRKEVTIRLGARTDMEGRAEGERPSRPRGERPEAENPKRPEPTEAGKKKGKEEAGGFLGIMAAPLNEDIRDLAGTKEGVLINSLTDDSPAAKAGLKPGDVIVRINDTPVASPEVLVEVLQRYKPGTRIRVAYYRMGKLQNTRVTLGRRPGTEPKREAEEPEPFPGLPEDLFRNMPELREYLKRLQPQIQEWARRFREQPRWPGAPRGLQPAHPGERAPYDVGKDLGRIMERLEGIEKRLDGIEKRLDRLER